MSFSRLQILLTHLRRAVVDMLLSLTALFTVTILPLLQMPGRRESLFAFSGLWAHVCIYAGWVLGAILLTRTYRMIWRYVSFRDFLRLIAAASIAMMGFMAGELLLMRQSLNVPGVLLVWTV